MEPQPNMSDAIHFITHHIMELVTDEHNEFLLHPISLS